MKRMRGHSESRGETSEEGWERDEGGPKVGQEE